MPEAESRPLHQPCRSDKIWHNELRLSLVKQIHSWVVLIHSLAWSDSFTRACKQGFWTTAMFLYQCVCVRACACACLRACVRLRACALACAHACARACVRVYVCVHVKTSYGCHFCMANYFTTKIKTVYQI